MTTHHTSGAADLPEALHVDRSEAVNLARNFTVEDGIVVTQKGVRILADAVLLMDAALTAQAISAEPAGAEYAELPEDAYRVHPEGLRMFDAAQMRDFADRTHAIRIASHGQAPAQAHAWGCRANAFGSCSCGQAPAGADSAPAEAVQRIVHLRADRERRVYVAGPMTGLPEFNFPLFNTTAARLRSEGWHVENPAEHGHVDGAGWADYLRWDISRIATCGAIYLLPDWQKSKGASLEVHIAGVLGLKVLLADGAAPVPTPQAADTELAQGAGITAVCDADYFVRDLLLTTLHVLSFGKFDGPSQSDASRLSASIIEFLQRGAAPQPAPPADSVLEDAARWRRLVNASEMAFPVAAIVDDPENDAAKVYGRKRMEALIDRLDEIPSSYADAARNQGGA